jgi:hypothetical protein
MSNSAGIQVGLGICTFISTICEIFLIVSHLSVAKLMKHPGSLILGQCCAHIIINLQCFTKVETIRDFASEIDVCIAIAWVTEYAYFACWCYIACLGLEIMFKVMKPSHIAYKRRMIIYHILSWTLAIALASSIFGKHSKESHYKGGCNLRLDNHGK